MHLCVKEEMSITFLSFSDCLSTATLAIILVDFSIYVENSCKIFNPEEHDIITMNFFWFQQITFSYILNFDIHFKLTKM